MVFVVLGLANVMVVGFFSIKISRVIFDLTGWQFKPFGWIFVNKY